MWFSCGRRPQLSQAKSDLAPMGRLEAVGLDTFALSSSSQPSSSSGSKASSGGSSSSSSVAAVTAAAIDLLSLVALDFANHIELEMHSGCQYQTRALFEQRLQQQRKQGGGKVVIPPGTPPPLLTERRGEQREPMPRDAWAAYADAGMRMALGPTLLAFYGFQLQQHLAQRQLQRQTVSLAEAHKQQPTAAGGGADHNLSSVGSSWEEAEGLLLLGADRLQGAAATDTCQQLAAVVAGWHRQLQQYRQALGYTEQQLAAAAALLADAGSSGSAANNNSSSSSSSCSTGSDLVSVRDCLRFLAAAAICLSGTPHMTLAAARDGRLNLCVLFDLLPLTPALLLAGAAAALELLPLQHSLPLVSHFVWWAGSARTEKDMSLRTTRAQLAPLELKAHARLQLQLWAGFDGAVAAVRQPHMKSLDAHVTAGIAGWLAQQLLRVAGTHTAPGSQHGSPVAAAAAAAAAVWGTYGQALGQCKVLLDGVFVEYWQFVAFCCLKPKPALFTHTAAALQVSEAIMRLQDQAAAEPAEAAAAGAGDREDDSTPAQQGDGLNFLAAVMFPITALQGLCQVPPELAKSVCGQQLLQAAVSALLTVFKRQGLRPAGDLVVSDVAACIDVASRAFSAVTAPAAAASPGGVQQSLHTQQQYAEQQGQAAACDTAEPRVSDAEALHLMLQLLARGTHLVGSSLMVMCEVEAAAAACWLMEERATLDVARRLQQATGQDGAMWVFSAPTTNSAGIASGLESFVSNVRRAVWPSSLLQSGDGALQPGGVHAAGNGEAANSRSSSRRSVCSGMLQVMACQLQEVEECSRLQKAAARDMAVISKRQWTERAVDLMTAMAENLLAVAGNICSTLPSRFCCSNPGCSSLATVSEGHALVRGQACVCGGCQAARYCSADCQAAHWRVHAGQCRIWRQCSTGRDCQEVHHTTAAAATAATASS